MQTELTNRSQAVSQLRAERQALLDEIDNRASSKLHNQAETLEKALYLAIQQDAAVVDHVRTQLQQSRSQVEALQQDVVATEAERCVLAEHLDKSRAAVEDGVVAHQKMMRAKQSERDVERQASEAKREEAQCQVNILEHQRHLEVQSGAAAVSEAHTELLAVQELAENLQQEFAAVEAERCALVEQLEEDMMAHRTKLHAVERERDIERQRIVEAERKRQEFDRQLQVVVKERNTMRLQAQEGACAKRYVRVVEQQRDSLRAENQLLEVRCQESQCRLAALAKERDDIVGQCDAQRRTSAALVSQCQHVSGLEKEQADLQLQMSTNMSELEESWRQIKTLQQERIILRLQVQRGMPALPELEESQRQVKALREETAALRLQLEKGAQAASEE